MRRLTWPSVPCLPRRGAKRGPAPILFLTLFLLRAVAPGFAEEAAPGAVAPATPRPGAGASAPDLTDAQRKAIERLQAIGYLTGMYPASAESGVLRYDRGRAAPGFNLYATGHAPELLLTDMDGRVLHRWSRGWQEIWPDFEPSPEHLKLMGYYRRAHLYPNGDVLVIVQGVGIAKLDRDSKVLWAHDNRAHHDLAVTDDGDIYVLTAKAHVVPGLGPKPILEDFLTVLDPQGREKRSISLLEAFRRGESSREILAELRLGEGRLPFDGDIFHTNTVSVLDGRARLANDAFRRGRILTSMRNLNTLAVIDLAQKKAVWTHRGDYRMQHDPQIVDDGKLLLFDNGKKPPSRILEMDPATMEVVWSFAGSPELPFYTPYSGAVQRLPNGNTLVTESMPGRVLEVTRAGEVVWEFRNPHRTGAGGELVAQIPEMVRLRPDFPLAWASGAAASGER